MLLEASDRSLDLVFGPSLTSSDADANKEQAVRYYDLG